jgi:hypothetical protein
LPRNWSNLELVQPDFNLIFTRFRAQRTLKAMEPTPQSPAEATPLLCVEYTPTEAEFVEGCRYPFRARHLKSMMITFFSALVIAAMGLLETGVSLRWALVAAGVCVGLALYSPFAGRRFLREFFRKHPQLSEQSVTTYTTEGVLMRTASIETFIRWHAFTHFEESARLIFLYRGPQNPVFVAKRVFATPADLEAYRQLLRQFIGRTSLQTQQGFPVVVATPAAGSR